MRDDEYLHMMNSTIVRSNELPRLRPLLRVAGRSLSALAPSLAAEVAERWFLTPPRHRRPAREVALIETARARPVRVDGSTVVETWRWGHGPTVLLVHGWGGRGSQLGALVAPLVAQGFSVVTFDAPGHGASSRRLVTIPEIVVASVRAVAAAHGPIAALVAHSAGAVVAARALYEGLEARAAVFLAPAADLAAPADAFTEALGFSRRVRERMQRRIEERVGMPWAAFRVDAIAAALGVPLLAVHDLGDGEQSRHHARAIARAWPGAELVTTDGLGHRRILRDPDVIARAVAFVTARVAEWRSADGSTPPVVPTEPLPTHA
jgi:pimeloyl-ACP methyl ester carboxylesterase